MVLVKINVAMPFVIILLSAKFTYGMKHGSGTEQNLPSASSRPQAPPQTTLFNLEAYRTCTQQLYEHFNENNTHRDYVQHAIISFTIFDNNLSKYVKLYYKTFYMYVTIGEIKPVKTFCQRAPALERINCVRNINDFFLYRDLSDPYDVLYHNTISHQIIYEIDIEPQVLLYSALYYVAADRRPKGRHVQSYVINYMYKVSKKFGLNLTPQNKQPFRKPYEYCQWIAQDSKNELQYTMDLNEDPSEE